MFMFDCNCNDHVMIVCGPCMAIVQYAQETGLGVFVGKWRQE